MLSRFGVLAAVEEKKNAKMVSLSEGNEVRRDGWQEVGVLHMTCEVGEPSQRDPMEERGYQFVDSLEGNMSRASNLASVLTKQQRIASLSRQSLEGPITSLNQCLDLEWMKGAWDKVNVKGSPGADGKSAADFELDLSRNLESLIDSAKSGSYKAPPVKRAWIPKNSHECRPIGLPTVADKCLQRAVVMLLEPIYETDFLDCSFGFRPGRGCHQAIDEIRRQMMAMQRGTIIEVDIRKFFDEMSHQHLRSFLKERIADGVVLRLIDKWLKAGVLENGAVQRSEVGSIQGGVISPILANIYLHHVLDRWFENEVKPRLAGSGFLVRYVDDFVMGFSDVKDAERVFEVLGKRFAKFGLRLHPDKTRIIPFHRPPRGINKSDKTSGSFDFLGFTLYWHRAYKGFWYVNAQTASSRLSRSLRKINEWCRKNRHMRPRSLLLRFWQKIAGHVNYFGIRGNSLRVSRFQYFAILILFKWMRRRTNKGKMTYERLKSLIQRFPPPRMHTTFQTQQLAKP